MLRSRKNTLIVVSCLAGALGLAGCYQESSVTVHEPGVYKGQKDTSLTKTASEEAHEKLNERFMLVQTDR